MYPDNAHLNLRLFRADRTVLDEEMARRNVNQDALIKQIIHQWVVLVDFEPKRSDFTLVLPPEYSALAPDEALPDFLNRVEVLVIETVHAREVTWARTAACLQYDPILLPRILKAGGSSRTLDSNVVPKHRSKTNSKGSPPGSIYWKLNDDSLGQDLAVLSREARRRKTFVNALAGRIVHHWAAQRLKSKREKSRIVLPIEACILYQDEGLKTYLNRVELAAVQSACFVEPTLPAVTSRLACCQIRKIFFKHRRGKRRAYPTKLSKETIRAFSLATGITVSENQDDLKLLLEANRANLVLQECNYDSSAASDLFGVGEVHLKRNLSTPVPPDVATALIATQPRHNPANNELALLTIEALSHLPGAATLSLADLERAHILSVLQRTNHDLERAAPVLGISPLTLRRKLAIYDALPSAL
jgi:hypothetical protein